MSRNDVSTLYFELANKTTDKRHRDYLLDLGRKYQEPIEVVAERTCDMALRARILNQAAAKEARP